MKKITCYMFTFFFLLSCNHDNSPLDEFDFILSKSNRILVKFNANKNFNEEAVLKIVSKSSQINELRNLMAKSTKSTNCMFYDGTMTFFYDTEKTGFLEFSVNPECPVFYLHISNSITQFKMTPYCAMFLESIRQGTN